MDRKQETAIRAEGAELYVSAYLMLVLGIPTSMASRNMPGYDLLAHNVTTGRQCRVQVKYRGAINSNGTRVHNLDFDFMVYVAGNVGRIGSTTPLHLAERRPPEFYVLPVDVVAAVLRDDALFVSPRRGQHEEYRQAWHLIAEFIDLPFVHPGGLTPL
jgi:hypothetical protein